MTQANPLLEYAQTHSAEAFATVIQQYQRFVFATCRRKLHDPADIDDAVQETFLRLAQKAGELHSNIGGWLHRCAVNVSLDLNRRREVRKRHESTAASYRHEPIDDAQKILAELREQIDAALDKLSADQRELIVQRYFVGRAQVELAAEAGVTSSAITNRLDRAIEALRSHLGQSGFSPAVAAGGAAAVERLLEAEAASATVHATLTANLMKIGLSGVTSSAVTVVGIGIMAKTLIGLAATLVVGAGVWLALIAQVSQPSAALTTAPVVQAPAATQPSSNPPAFTVNATGDNPAQAAPSPQWQNNQPATRPTVLSGRVTDSAGKPIANAVVKLYPVLASGGVVLPPNPPQATTDAEGLFNFPWVPRDGGYKLAVEADGYVGIPPSMSSTTLEIAAKAQARRDFVLDRGVPVTVTLTNSLGEAIKRNEIDVGVPGDELQRRSSLERVTTDDLGYASFVLPVSKTPYVVAARVKDYAPVHQLVTPESADKPLQIQLIVMRGMSVPGVAICSDGKPATGWAIIAKPDWWASGYIPPSALIDADGKFTLANITPGGYTIHLSKGNTYYQIATATLPTPDGKPLQLNILEVSPASLVKLSGRVNFIGGTGRLSPGSVGVVVQNLSGSRGRGRSMVNFGPAGGQGTFTVDGLPPGAYRISFESPSTERKVIDRFEVPGQLPDTDLRVISKPRLSGNIIDAATGQSITHFAYRVRKVAMIGTGPNYGSDNVKWTQVSNADGAFSTEMSGPGVYQVQASVPGYAWLWSPEIRLEENASLANTVVKLSSGGMLTGMIVDANGNPISGAKVIALSMAKSITNSVENFEGDSGSVLTDEQGRFTFAHLAPGNETIKLLHQNYAQSIVYGLKIAEAQTTNIGQLKLGVGGMAEGILYDGNGEPLAGEVISFRDDPTGNGIESDTSLIATATTDEKGRFHVEHLPGKPIYASLSRPYQRVGVWRRTFRPIEGKTTHLDFGGMQAVQGRLLDGAGKPLAGRRVNLAIGDTSFGPVISNNRTDSEGNFQFLGAPAGKYTLFGEPMQRGNWIKLREVDLDGQAKNLGNVVQDLGNVVITMTADDPAQLQGEKYVVVQTDLPARAWQESISTAERSGSAPNAWIASAVPPGKYSLRVIGRDVSNEVGVTIRFERKAGVEETRVNVHIPRATATLSAKITSPENISDGWMRWLIVTNEDGTMFATLQTDKSEVQSLKLPPDTYTILDPTTMKRRAGIEPIVLSQDETRIIEIDARTSGGPTAPVLLSLQLWDFNGNLDNRSTIKLLDDSGKSIEMIRPTEFGALFLVKPGTFQATIKRPNAAAVRREVIVKPVSEDRPRKMEESAVDLFMD